MAAAAGAGFTLLEEAKMTRHNSRSPATGRFRRVDVSNTPLSAESKFDTAQGLEVQARPERYAYELTPRDDSSAGPAYDAPHVADDLAVTGSRLRARRPAMVHPGELARDEYGVHNEVMRSAARDSGPMDPSGYLTGCTDESEHTT
jgi:hypothetical protein